MSPWKQGLGVVERQPGSRTSKVRARTLKSETLSHNSVLPVIQYQRATSSLALLRSWTDYQRFQHLL